MCSSDIFCLLFVKGGDNGYGSLFSYSSKGYGGYALSYYVYLILVLYLVSELTRPVISSNHLAEL